MPTTVTWFDIPATYHDLPPFEQLMYGAKLSASRPSGEPWLATLGSTDKAGDFFTVSLSLDGSHVFEPGAQQRFERAASQLLARARPAELSNARRREVERGNPGELVKVGEGLLRVIVPAHLVSEAQAEIVRALLDSEESPVRVTDAELD